MFELTKTFTHTTGFSLTPIKMQSVGFIFIPQELQEQLGYENLSDMVRQSDSFAEGIEYVILRNSNLKLLKDLLNSRNTVPRVQEPLYEMLKHSPALIVLTESGLYTTMFLSRKPYAQDFRRWVTGEVLPSIRKTGMYKMPGLPSSVGDVSKLVIRLASLESKIAQLSDDQMKFQQYALRGFDRIEAVLSDSLPHDIFDIWKNIKMLIDDMTEIYGLSDAERKRYFRELCQAHDIKLPEKALLERESRFHDAQDLAIKIGVYSTTNKPHSRLVLALIRHLKLNQDRYCQHFPMVRSGYSATICKYSDNVIPHLVGWLQEQSYPETIELRNENSEKTRRFRVRYRSNIRK